MDVEVLDRFAKRTLALPEEDRPVKYADYVDEARRIYPDDVHAALAAGLSSELGPEARLMGSSCGVGNLRQSDDWEAVWTISPRHPIARGLPPVFVIPTEEVYCEYFDIPAPDEVVFLSTFRGGEVFRSGCCFRRGNGRIFYFRPGHESHPTYHHPQVKRVLANAVTWAGESSPPGAGIWNLDEDKPTMLAHLVPEGWFRPPGVS